MIRNNHGWGLKEMLFFSAIIFFFVILAFVLINNLYQGLTGESAINQTYSYTSIEQNLSNAAKKYARSKNTSNLIISEDLMDAKYLKESEMKTKDDVCAGYVLVEENYKAYITCNNYETMGY